jgi:hypothetical protein
MFIIPQRNNAAELADLRVPHPTLGSFEVYWFEKPNNQHPPRAATHIASLELPILRMDEYPMLTLLRSSPAIPSTRLCQFKGFTGLPKAYELPAAHQLLGIELRHSDHYYLQGTQFVQLAAVLATVSALGTPKSSSQNGPSIPWKSWGQGFWAPPELYLANPSCAVYGYRAVSRWSPTSGLIVLDLDSSRLKSIPNHYHGQMCNSDCLIQGCSVDGINEPGGWHRGEHEEFESPESRKRINEAFMEFSTREDMKFLCHWFRGNFRGHDELSNIFMDEENSESDWCQRMYY